jgi:hypothetical protein
MKKILTLTAFVTIIALMFAACYEVLSPDDVPKGAEGDLDNIAVDYQRLSLDRSELATIEGYSLKLTMSGSPDFATRKEIRWESSDSSVAAVDQSGAITTTGNVGDEPKTAVIKVYSVYDPSVYAVCPVTVYPDYGSNRSWDFGASFIGKATNADTDLGYGMTLKGATGSGAYNNAAAAPDGKILSAGLIPSDIDTPIETRWTYPAYPWVYQIDPDDPYLAGVTPTNGARSSMNWNGTSSSSTTNDSVPAGSGWQSGSLRTNGVGRILSIAALKGPFYIEVRYTTNTNETGRWAEIRIGDREGIRIQGSPSYHQTQAGGGGIAAYTYEKDDVVPFVYVESQASVRLHEVIIKAGADFKPYIPVYAFTIPGDTTQTIGAVKNYTTSLRPGITNPVFEWSIVSGGEFGEIIGPANGPAAQVNCKADGDFTVQVTVTTTNPNDGTTDTYTATKNISALVYRPITGVAITPAAAVEVEVDSTVDLTAAPTPAGATNPVYAWTITSGDTFAEISAGAATNKATITGKAVGTVTVQVTVTTTDPANAASTATQTATKTITVKEPPPPTGGTDVFWNFSETPGAAVTYSTETTINGLTILPATSGSHPATTSNNKSIDGFSFGWRLQLNGTGSTTQRALKFSVTGPCTIKVYGMAGSGSAIRALALSDGTSEQTQDFPGDVIYRKDYTYNGSTATLYIYSKDSGINLYGVKVEYR